MTRRDPGFDLSSNNFDTLRLVFASMVVFYHIGILSKLPAFAGLERYISSTFAVQAFFVVSGLLVTMSCERSTSLRTYATKRLLRIVPAYVVVVVGAAVLLSARSALPMREYFTHPGFWRYLGYNLLLSNFAAPSLPEVFTRLPETAVNGSLWTIKIEVAFYCIVPLLVWACRKWGYRRVLPALFVASIAWKVGFARLASHTEPPFFAKLSKHLPGQLSFFAGGAWTYYWARDGRTFSFPFFVVGLLTYMAFGEDRVMPIAPILVTFIVAWAALKAPRLPRPPDGNDYSYGVYLYHFPIVQCFIESDLLATHPWTAFTILLLLVALVAAISWHFIERPMLPHRKKPVVPLPQQATA